MVKRSRFRLTSIPAVRTTQPREINSTLARFAMRLRAHSSAGSSGASEYCLSLVHHFTALIDGSDRTSFTISRTARSERKVFQHSRSIFESHIETNDGVERGGVKLERGANEDDLQTALLDTITNEWNHVAVFFHSGIAHNEPVIHRHLTTVRRSGEIFKLGPIIQQVEVMRCLPFRIVDVVLPQDPLSLLSEPQETHTGANGVNYRDCGRYQRDVPYRASQTGQT